ncbi:hypothetical protein A3709_19545 [Halioglobus sp. HI00S01]|nr:hypothetical protein A3709_19545 [Halioglobus sp. HI00S01]
MGNVVPCFFRLLSSLHPNFWIAYIPRPAGAYIPFSWAWRRAVSQQNSGLRIALVACRCALGDGFLGQVCERFGGAGLYFRFAVAMTRYLRFTVAQSKCAVSRESWSAVLLPVLVASTHFFRFAVFYSSKVYLQVRTATKPAGLMGG